MVGQVLLFCLLISSTSMPAMAAQRDWPGAPPDCWREERIVHSADFDDLWQANATFKKLPGEKLKPGVYSSNKAYYFVAEDGRPKGAVTIFAEKSYLLRIEFSDLFNTAICSACPMSNGSTRS